MTLMDKDLNIYTDEEGEISPLLRNALLRSGSALEKMGDTLYRFNPDGVLDMFDISRKPFCRVSLTLRERVIYKKNSECFTADYHILPICDGKVQAYGDDNKGGVFPTELILRW